MIKIITPKSDLRPILEKVMACEFDISIDNIHQFYQDNIGMHTDEIIDTAYVFVESPYVDKVYRDSYYAYFSSKFGKYKRDCIRLSFFDGEIREEHFSSETEMDFLQDRYLGFMIIRPTEPFFLGRSVIRPQGVKTNHFLNVEVNINATVNAIKLSAKGFPHSSQDTETITCAETTLWAIMEYFGTKYPDYKPAPPSKIISVLKRVSAERQVPSKGLNIQQIAFALKEFGFGTKIYSRGEFGKAEFKRLFSTYIESGIPLIVALENTMHGSNIGHAILSIGRKKTEARDIDDLAPTDEMNPEIKTLIQAGNLQFFDHDDINRHFVFVDDNRPIYQLGKLDTPTSHYPNAEWHNCEITHFVVPLYPKVYLEAYKAKSFFKILLLRLFNIQSGSELFIRFYLTSSRSYKHELVLNRTFDTNIKSLILDTPMPKFIWIGEISTKELIKQELASGVIIIDATEANLLSLKALIFATYKNEFIYFDEKQKNFTKNALSLQSFSIFTNNLKGF